MQNNNTIINKAKIEIKSFLKNLKNNPSGTVMLVTVVVFTSIFLNMITPFANDLYKYIFHNNKSNHFSSQQTIYSNFVPFNSDYISLDEVGKLIPAPYNRYFNLSPDGICIPSQDSLINYRDGIVLVLNLPALYTATTTKHRSIEFKPPLKEDYYIFKLGDIKEIKIEKRRFIVKLSNMNDLSTTNNGPYFSYTFNINER